MATATANQPNDSFTLHADAVYGWAFRVLGRHHDALDVVQDVYLRWHRQCRDAIPTWPRGWLRRVTVNRAIDAVRDECGRSRDAVDDLPALAAVNKSEGTVDSADTESLRFDVARGLGELTEMQRGVLVAKVFDALTFAEIAEELDVAVSTVKTHYLRAVLAMRDRLKAKWADW